MALTTGTRLGPYEIVSPLGAGGMGEVYRARDSRLKREVALKILPESFAADPERLARFQREAEVLASLNHPNIAAIYGLEEQPAEAGLHVGALVLELVEGETLADRIARGAIPLDEALPIARQIAEALEAAHERGIIHRDLKPANVKVTSAGAVKVLDFGLAKLAGSGSGIGDQGSGRTGALVTNSPTITSPAMMTGAGMILGTAAYMSPEQAKGREADKRSDIWAFGCVLFEMLTGRRPFPGDDLSEVFASILARDIDWTGLPASTPPSVHRVLRRSLQKDPRQRLRDMGDVSLELEAALMEPASGGRDAPTRSRRLAAIAGGCALAGLLVGGAGVMALRGISGTTGSAAHETRFEVVPDDVPAGSLFNEIAMTPDGRQVIYAVESAGSLQLYRRFIGRLAAEPLDGTQNARDLVAVSPRGDQMAFAAAGELKVVPVDGGSSTAVTRLQGDIAGGAWIDDTTIVFAQAGGKEPGLLRVPASGGSPTVVARPDSSRNEREYRYPHMLPDGESVVFTILPQRGGLAAARIAVRSLRTGEQKDLVEGGTDAVYLPAGYLLFGRTGGLAVVPFDIATLTTSGRPHQVAEGVATTGAGNVWFGVATDGTLAYIPGTTEPPRRLIRVTPDGRHIEPVTSEALAGARYPRFSARDDRLAVTTGPGFAGDVWVHALDGARQPARLTFEGHDLMPVWSPDGQTIVFQSDRSGSRSLFATPSDGSVVEPELLLASDKSAEAWDWSPDGRTLLFSEFHPETRSDLWTLPTTGDRTPRPWLATSFEERAARFSPDGRFIAYVTDQSGAAEVWIRRADGSAPVRVSSGGGVEPVWARDGRELFYQAGARLMAVAILQTSPEVRFGPPRVVLDGGFFASSRNTPRTYDMGPDGRLLMLQPLGEAPAPSFVVVQHWLEELTRVVPVN